MYIVPVMLVTDVDGPPDVAAVDDPPDAITLLFLVGG